MLYSGVQRGECDKHVVVEKHAQGSRARVWQLHIFGAIHELDS